VEEISFTIQTEYQSPFQLLSFSLDESRNLIFDNSALRYYVDPPRNADLNHRYEHWIKRPEERTRLDNLLRACLKKEASRERKRANVITWRGIMTKIFTAPYEHRDSWSLNAMLVGDTLYLEEYLDPEQIQEKEAMSTDNRRMSYYGYSFESFCTLPHPKDASPEGDGWGGDVNTNVQWCSVVKTKLNDLRIIMAAEVDCVRAQYTGQPDTFVELKTSLEPRPGDRNGKRRWEMKLLKFYTQSFLLGVPEIVVGFRDRNGYLKTVQPLRTNSIPRLVRNSTRQWDHLRCQAWAYAALSHIRTVIKQKGTTPDSVWRIVFEPDQGLRLRLLSAREVEASAISDENRIGILPLDYWKIVTKTSDQADIG